MVGWHRRLNGHEFEQTLGDGEGQGNLVCYSSCCCKESDMTGQWNNTTVVKNPPTNTGNMASIPGTGTPHMLQSN